jgi:hypothetical protein
VTRVAGGIAKAALLFVGLFLFAAAGLFLLAAALTTYPVTKLPPRQRHMKAALDAAVAVAALVAVVKAGDGPTIEQEADDDDDEND